MRRCIFSVWYGVIYYHFLPKQLLWGGAEVIISDGEKRGLAVGEISKLGKADYFV